MTKSVDQQIADMQNKLNALKTKKQADNKRQDTRYKIIMGAEVFKALGVVSGELPKMKRCLLLGLISCVNNLNEDDKRTYARAGQDLLKSWEDSKKAGK